jgi:UDP-N-acetylglucosamine 1-carboxyvinyltransferase
MGHFRIHGPAQLKGTVAVQGSKNAAMKHVLMPLLVNDTFTFTNIPQIGSTQNLLELVKLQGAQVIGENNTVHINSQQCDTPQLIPADLFYYTSGAIFLLTILASKFGEVTLEINPHRDDYGGCQIGSRDLNTVLQTLEKLGISNERKNTRINLKVQSKNTFSYEVPNKSFGASVNAVIAALFKKGTSEIKNITGEADFYDTVRFFTAGRSAP